MYKRQELCRGLISLEAARISRGVNRVSQQDPVLGAALAERAARLQYSAIHHALQGEGAAEHAGLAASEKGGAGGAA